MKFVLVACEESQTVCKAFRSRGFAAFSCDVVPCSGGHPEWHVMQDCLTILDGGAFTTCDGKKYFVPRWDLIIAHPPCTYLTKAGNALFSIKRYSDKTIAKRSLLRLDAARFFLEFINADCDHIAIENPVGVMSSIFHPANQVISPYMFASGADDIENYQKKMTCLWLIGLPILYTNSLAVPDLPSWAEHVHGHQRRSKTFPGVAAAMALQWGDYINV